MAVKCLPVVRRTTSRVASEFIAMNKEGAFASLNTQQLSHHCSHRIVCTAFLFIFILPRPKNDSNAALNNENDNGSSEYNHSLLTVTFNC